jgi:hypothetical protein
VAGRDALGYRVVGGMANEGLAPDTGRGARTVARACSA